MVPGVASPLRPQRSALADTSCAPPVTSAAGDVTTTTVTTTTTTTTTGVEEGVPGDFAKELAQIAFVPSDKQGPDTQDAQIATAYSSLKDTQRAVEEAARQLHNQLGGVVDLVIVSATSNHPVEKVQGATARIFADVNLAANTSSGGMITQDKALRSSEEDSHCLALWGIRDRQGLFSVGEFPVDNVPAEDGSPIGKAWEAAGRAAAERATHATDAAGDSNSLCWVMVRPGYEDDVLHGVRTAI
eukprot:COSAG06_NODE_14520_length_1150_cov_0.805899_1_plen_243_part_10